MCIAWPIVWIRVSFFPHSCHHQWDHDQSGCGGKDGGNRGFPFSKADLAMDPAKCPVCQDQRMTLSLNMALFPGVISLLPGGRLIALDCFHHEKGSIFHTGVDSSPGYWSVFLTCSASANTTLYGLKECLIHHHCISPDTISDQGTHFAAKEVWQWMAPSL